MMNYWISGGIGAAIGSAAGYIVAKIRYEKKLAKEVEAKVNAILEEARYKQRSSKKEEETNSSDDEKEGDRVTYSSVIDGYSASKDDYYSAKKNVDPAEKESPREEEEFEDLSEMDPDEYEEKVANGELITDENRGYIETEEYTREVNSGKPPRLITEESYLNDYPNFDKTELAYYTGVNGEGACLIDIEADEEILDEYAFVGDCLDRFGFRSSDEERIFVRNFNLNNDFEIKKTPGAFEIF